MPRCPVCKEQAPPIDYEGARIYHCGGCGGHWLTRERLDRILKSRDTQMPEAVKQKMMDIADASNSTQELYCMGCGASMIKEQFKYWDDIQIDRCPKCHGIWLDKGELEKCQIYWEYAQDNPNEWENSNVEVRKQNLEAQLALRRLRNKEERENIPSRRGEGLSWLLDMFFSTRRR